MATNEHLVKCDPDLLNVEGLRMRAFVCLNEFKRSKQASAADKEQAWAAMSALLGLDEANATAEPPRQRQRKQCAVVPLPSA